MQISTDVIKELREQTSAGLMECKRALEECEGDLEAAATKLRERGYAIAQKKEDRVARQGLVECYVHTGGRIGAMVELNCEWLDVGAWGALEEVCERDDAGNVVLAEQCLVLDTTRSIIVSDDGQLLAVLGMDECVVVHSKDATLVCNKSDCQQIKHLVDLIEEKYPKKYT